MNQTQIAIVAAMAQNRVIGINNTLPWRIPADLQHFKRLTLGHTLIMGRKTYDSIGRPLPGRRTIVISRNPKLQLEGCQIAHSWSQALELAADSQRVFVVGGAEIYQLALPQADLMYLTEIQQSVEGDAWFPEFETQQWLCCDRQIESQQQPEPLEYHFVTYQRRR